MGFLTEIFASAIAMEAHVFPVPISCIINNKGRATARSGLGAIMGFASAWIKTLPSGAVVCQAMYLWKKARKIRLAAVTRIIKMSLEVSPDLTRRDASMTSCFLPQL